jgi:hypothetical protein
MRLVVSVLRAMFEVCVLMVFSVTDQSPSDLAVGQVGGEEREDLAVTGGPAARSVCARRT